MTTHPPLPPNPVSAPAPIGLPPKRVGHIGVGAVVAVVVLGLLGIVAVGVVGLSIGVAALPGAALLALVPLAGVLLAIRWVDKWEREPWQALAVAFGWGASVSVLVALVLNTGVQLALLATGSSQLSALTWSAVVVAPVVEESIKAAGVLLVFLVWRRMFDGPVDGLVYAATVAAGFAFVENILYFGNAIAGSEVMDDAGSVVVMTFMMRAVMSPFAHLLFTACTGLALGLAARSRSRYAWLWLFPLGLTVATVLHALWNGSAMFNGLSGFFWLYALFQVPLFIGAVVGALWLRRREADVVRTRLSEYATQGWFAPAEVSMLASLRERRHARGWAKGRGGSRAGAAMRAFQHASTRLAYQRHRILTGRADQRTLLDEHRLLAEVNGARHELMSSLPV